MESIFQLFKSVFIQANKTIFFWKLTRIFVFYADNTGFLRNILQQSQSKTVLLFQFPDLHMPFFSK